MGHRTAPTTGSSALPKPQKSADFNQFFYGMVRQSGQSVGVHKFRGRRRRKNGAFNGDMKHILTRGLTAHYLLELCRIIHVETREPWANERNGELSK